MTLFDFIKANVPILSVIQEYTSLKPIGLYWKGVCPFHSEKTASFTVSPHKDIFYCFGCQAGGDVIAFIAKIENASQMEAARSLIDKYKINVPQELLKTSEQFYSSDQKNSYFRVCEFIADWCHKKLLKDNAAMDYVKKRGLEQKIIDEFKIGYFPSKKELNSIIKSASYEGLMVKDLIDANIVIDHKSNDLFSPFEDRIIFPINNGQGECCGFGGRIFIPGDERAKYYNSKENPFFNKGSILFGFDKAKKYIQKSEAVFLVEGYMDHLAMVQNGILNTVATLGTACTHEHLKTISRFANKVHVLFDGDDAGQKAVLRLTELAWDVNIDIDVITLPKDEDPASYLTKNNGSSNFLENRIDIFSFFIRSKKRDFLNLPLADKLTAVKKITDIINKLNDPVKQGILFQNVAQEFNIPLHAIQQKVNFITNENDSSADKDSVEYKILGAILHDKSLIDGKFKIVIDFLPIDIKNIIEIFKLSENFDLTLKKLDDNSRSLAIKTYMSFKPENQNLDILLNIFQKKNWKFISGALKEKINSAQKSGNSKELMEYLKQLNEWKSKVLSS